MVWIPVLASVPYILILSWILYRLLKTEAYKPEPPGNTFVTIITACKNEEKNLPLFLEAISRQDYPASAFEIIIADDNSTDKTAAIAADFRSGIRISVVSNKGRGKKSAIRSAAEKASGELIVTADADTVPGKSWLSSIESFYHSSKPSLIIGPVYIKAASGFWQRFQAVEFLALQGVTAGAAAAGSAVMCNGANLAFTRKSYIENAAGIRPEVAGGDDVFLLHSMKKSGNTAIRWLESPDAAVPTLPVEGARSMLDQRSRWIGKSIYYNDAFTIVLGLTTFAAILSQATLTLSLAAGSRFILPLAVLIVLKSLPEFLLIRNRAKFYRQPAFPLLFIPFLILYPFYVLAVIMITLFRALKEV
jgi:cellulose synthase/poly-beta-1,6-N-acetylglucosamine synthase-like glycosyltransferase